MQPRRVSRASRGTNRGRTKTAVRGTTFPVSQLHSRQAVRVHDQAGDGCVDEPDVPRGETLALFAGQWNAAAEVHDVVRPLSDQVRVSHGLGASPQDTERLIADLMAMAVRAMQYVTTPALADSWNVWCLVAQASGDDQAPSPQRGTVVDEHLEPRVAVPGSERLDPRHGAVDEMTAVAGDLIPSGGQEFGGRQTVGAQEALHVSRRGVPGLAGVDNRDVTPGAAQNQGGGQSGCPPPMTATSYSFMSSG